MTKPGGTAVRAVTPLRLWAQRALYASLAAAALSLMLLSRAEPAALDRAQAILLDAVAPLLEAAGRPVDTLTDTVISVQELTSLRDANADLRAENERLLEWQGVALKLEAENARLRQLLAMAPTPTIRAIAGRVVADPGGAFVRSVLVNAGARDGAARGQAAVTGKGLVGRVVQVGNRSARVLLLTDMNSRIPVVVGEARHRAVLAGDNSERPRLLHLDRRAVVETGARVVTSGHGGVLPPDLPVGTVHELGETAPRVELEADPAHLEHLRLLDYELPGLLRRDGLAGSDPTQRPASQAVE